MVLLAVFLYGCCSPLSNQAPVADEEILPRGCLLWALKAEAQLPAYVWKRVLVVTYLDSNEDGSRKAHAYCIYIVNGRIWAYDTLAGSKSIYPTGRSAEDVMKATDKDGVEAYYLEDKK